MKIKNVEYKVTLNEFNGLLNYFNSSDELSGCSI